MVASAPQIVVFAIDGPIARSDLPRLCEQACALIDKTGADVALCDVSKIDPDAVSVDALARLESAATIQVFAMDVRLPNGERVSPRRA